MVEFKIRAEKLPLRCDICHKSDRFDAQSGNCSRCAGIDFSSNREIALLSPRPPRFTTMLPASMYQRSYQNRPAIERTPTGILETILLTTLDKLFAVLIRLAGYSELAVKWLKSKGKKGS